MFIYRYKIKFDCMGYLGSRHMGEITIDSTSEKKAIEKAQKIIEFENLIFCENADFQVISKEGIWWLPAP